MFKREIPACVDLQQFARDLQRSTTEAVKIQRRLAAAFARRATDRHEQQKPQTQPPGERSTRRES